MKEIINSKKLDEDNKENINKKDRQNIIKV